MQAAGSLVTIGNAHLHVDGRFMHRVPIDLPTTTRVVLLSGRAERLFEARPSMRHSVTEHNVEAEIPANGQSI
jgi:hypothetical protein